MANSTNKTKQALFTKTIYNDNWHVFPICLHFIKWVKNMKMEYLQQKWMLCTAFKTCTTFLLSMVASYYIVTALLTVWTLVLKITYMYILKWTNICQITVVPMFSLSTLYTFEEFHIANYNYLCPLCPIHLELFRLTVRVGHAYKMERFQEMTKQT